MLRRHQVWLLLAAFARFVAELCAVAPLGLSFLYFALAVDTRVLLGHWPRYWEFTDLCKIPTFMIVNVTFWWWGIFALCGAPLVWGLLHCFKVVRPTTRQRLRQARTFACGWAIFILLLFVNLCGFSDFVIDG